MQFTYDAYENLLLQFKEAGYSFIFFKEEHDDDSKEVILRHDIDNSLEDALRFAEIEARIGAKSTYFVLLGTEFYNVFTKESKNILKKIMSFGHEIGLHFDISCYEEKELGQIENLILAELATLSKAIDRETRCVSFHRPLKEYFNKKISNKFVSAYEEKYFSGFSYVSDSRRNWRDNPIALIESGVAKIQCLTHAFWYRDEEISSKERITDFLEMQGYRSARALSMNLTDIEKLTSETFSENIVADMKKESLKTDRLEIKLLDLQDVEDIYQIGSNTETVRYLKWGPYKTKAEAERFIKKSLVSYVLNNDLIMGIHLKDKQKLIGIFRLYGFDDEKKSCEISYIQASNFTGNGYMTETIENILKSLENRGIKRVYANYDMSNLLSYRLMKRVGMKDDEEFRMKAKIKGKEVILKRCLIDLGGE